MFSLLIFFMLVVMLFKNLKNSDTAKNAENLFGDRKEPPAISSSKHVYWEHAIKWAQNTLVCKDTLTQVIR